MSILVDYMKLVFWKIRSFFLKYMTKIKNPNVYFGKNIQIIGANKVNIGKSSTIGDNFWLNINNKGIKDNKIIVDIGLNSNIGRNNFFTVGNGLKIGDYFFSSCYCSIVCATHNNENPFKPYIITEIIDLGDGVNIGANVFMGAHSMISGSVNIGFGSIIASGSVVTDDIPPLSIVAGYPAKVVKRFCLDKNEWVSPSEINERSVISEEEYKKMIILKNPRIIQARHAASVKMGWT